MRHDRRRIRSVGRGSSLLLAAVLAASAALGSSGETAAAAAPPNDLFADAAVLTDASLPYGPVTLDTTYATSEPASNPYHYCDGDSYTAHDVWYRYTSATGGGVQVNTLGSDFDTRIVVWQGTTLDNLDAITCAHKSGVFGQFVAFHATAGLSYWIQVGGAPNDGATNPYGSLHVTIKDQDPPNDLFADAAVLTDASLPYGPVTLDTTYATSEPASNPYHYCDGDSYTAHDVWYRYTSATGGGVQVNTLGSDFDTRIVVWQGTTLDNLDAITCAHKSGVFGQFVAFHATAGLSYWIQVGGAPNDGATNPYGSLHVTIKDQDPPNDLFADAAVLTDASLPYGPVTLDTTYATSEPASNPYHYCDGDSYTAHDVWYRYTSATGGGVQVNTLGSDFDTRIVVWQGTTLDNLDAITCAHKSGVKGQSVSFHATAGLSYWIQVGGAAGDAATKPYGSLKVAFPDPDAPPAPSTPGSTLVTGKTVISGSLPVTFAWTGTAGSSPIASYDVETRVDSGAWSAPASQTAASKTVNCPVPSHSCQVRVQTVDTVGRHSPWATSASASPAAYQESSSAIRYRGTWSTVAASSFSGGKAKRATAARASVTFTFTGRSVAWVGLKCSRCGSVKVYVNGTYLTTVSTYASTTAYKRFTWTKNWSTSSTRTLKLVAKGTAGHPRVHVDLFAKLK